MIYLYFFYLVVGFIFFYKTLKKPENYLEIFLISIIIGSGAMVMGYPIVDEYAVAMLLTGVFIRASLARSTGVIKFTNKSNLDLHNFLFYSLVVYLLISSVRGMFVLNDLRMFRWIFFFIIVGSTSFILSNYRFLIDRKKIIKIIFYSTNTYFIAYFIIGFIFDQFTGMTRYDIQGYAWSGTSAAAVPLILYSISLVFFWEEFKHKRIFLRMFFSIILVFTCAVYYDSRISILILSFTMFYFLTHLIKESFIFSLLLSPLIVIFITLIFLIDNPVKEKIKKYTPYDYQKNIIAMPEIISPGTDDLDRFLEPKAALLAIKYETDKLFFGYGWYVARIVIKDTSNTLRTREGLPIIHGNIYQPAGLSAMLVDTGIIGCILFIANLFLSIVKIYKYNSKHKFFTSMILSLVIIFLFIGNITPLLLTFVLVMPNSPIFMIVNNKKKTNLLNN